MNFFKNWIRDWPVWWSEQSSFRKYFPAFFVVLYPLALHALHSLREDHLQICAAIFVLSYGGRPLAPVLSFLLPLISVGVVYDSQRFYEDYIRGPIHVSEPYNFDKKFFGIATAQGVLTPNEWFQLHTYWLLDLITGFMYLFFIAIYTSFSAYLFFWVTRKDTPKLPAKVARASAGRMMWSFFWLNVIGYSTYYWYAAAPPWYVAQYGLGPANLSALPSPAGCLRFDALLGVHVFAGMYSKSADVFGAIPSLHVSYPLLAVYYAFKLGTGRAFALGFYLLMCFSAVYLNHHYILDILWGSAYALLVATVMEKIAQRQTLKK